MGRLSQARVWAAAMAVSGACSGHGHGQQGLVSEAHRALAAYNTMLLTPEPMELAADLRSPEYGAWLQSQRKSQAALVASLDASGVIVTSVTKTLRSTRVTVSGTKAWWRPT